MKKNLLPMLLAFFCSFSNANACDGNVTLSSQSDVDAFSCTEILGDLLISGADIANLDALSVLTSVQGKLMIKNNPELVDVKPLVGLTSVGSLIVVNNDKLRNLNGLFNLSSITNNLSIKKNQILFNFTGLGPVKKLVNLEISQNPGLENLDGLDKLKEADVLLVNDNESLLNVDGLSSMRLLTHMQITMSGNVSMQNCCGLYNLWTSGTVYGVVDIRDNGVSCDRQTVIFDCDPNESSCFATEVIAYQPGTTKDGRPVSYERSFTSKALGTPQENDEINFVALGFGGKLTLRLGADLYDDGTDQPEFILVETSFGLASTRCFEGGTFNNPESAFIELSADGQTWFSLPNIQCRTTFVDIRPAVQDGMPYARFVRITDVSNPAYFVGESDGYDVDGLIICQDEVLAGLNRLTNARSASTGTGLFDPNFFNSAPNDINSLYEGLEKDFNIYPNPVTEETISLEFKSIESGVAIVDFIDMKGVILKTENIDVVSGINLVTMRVSTLPRGQYVVSVRLEDQQLVEKLVK